MIWLLKLRNVTLLLTKLAVEAGWAARVGLQQHVLRLQDAVTAARFACV
jgi:hypothetical protein